MHRTIVALAAVLAACVTEPSPDELTTTTAPLTGGAAIRERVAGDVYHYAFTLPLGVGPNARIVVHRVVRERAPGLPRATTGAIVLMHGDFATFRTNFLPAAGGGLAAWLAARDVDVWGLDRRWTQAPEVGADLSDFGAMDLDQELDDIGAALAFARTVRVLTGGGADRLNLAGFSRGGQLAYFYASRDAARPPLLRQVKGLVPLDVYASLDPADEDLRAFNCGNAAYEYDQLAGGAVDVPNDVQIAIGRLAQSDPEGQSPFYPPTFPVTNRELMLSFVGETYYYFGATPRYHLNAPILDEDTFVIGLSMASEDDVNAWLAGAAPHQSLRESADTDALVCGDAPLPLDVPLARIRVPVLLIAAAGGYGAHAIYSTTQVASTDVTVHLVRRLPVEREAEDFGHADLLFSPDAAALAWQPLLAWLRHH